VTGDGDCGGQFLRDDRVLCQENRPVSTIVAWGRPWSRSALGITQYRPDLQAQFRKIQDTLVGIYHASK
jgi:hypothetical protein